jgi:probable FeS assembly SUF system protein SufT
MSRDRVLSRDIEVVTIPFGEGLKLAAGTSVAVTQALGGSFTAMTERGQMVRIEGRDAEAIGEQGPSPTPSADRVTGTGVNEQVWAQLKACFDPEIPVNIVDLGLVYACEVSELESGGHKVSIDFTLTSPACPLSPMLEEDIRSKVAAVAGVREIAVQVVFEPLWNSSMMSDAARLQLGLM